jgi:hypothetical protein
VAAPAGLPIAVGWPSGLIGAALVEAGHRVRINPDLLKSCRPHKSAAGGKSDPGDTFLLAEVLRTDGLRFRPLRPAPEHDNPIALAFSGCLPTCDRAGQLCEKHLTAFIAQHACCGRRSPAELLERLRAAPAGLTGEAKVKGQIARPFIEHAVAGLLDGRIVCLARAQRLRVAQLLAELGGICERFPTDDQLAAEANVRPVIRQSDESRTTGLADNSNHACA